MSLEIYGTLGPSCCTQEIIEDLLKSGMTGMRLNLSHCNLDGRKAWIEAFHQACAQTQINADFMIDMQGPELRTLNTQPIYFQPGDQVVFNTTVVPFPIVQHAQKNDFLLMDDGKIQFQINAVYENELHCVVCYGQQLNPRKSIMLQGKQISGPLFTENDLKNLKNAEQFGVTAIMQPFVSGKDDLISIKNTLESLNLGHLKIYAKIENMMGVSHASEMMHCCDCIVIARGDLGNACGLVQLPHIQKEIEQLCHQHQQNYMVVTEMLNSMIHQPVPTRAEVSDIYHAVYHGAQAIMLTGETANGNYPVQAMKIFAQVAQTALNDKTKEKSND